MENPERWNAEDELYAIFPNEVGMNSQVPQVAEVM
jgi:hypothetical protein